MKRLSFLFVTLFVFSLTALDCFAGLMFDIEVDTNTTVKLVQGTTNPAGLGGVVEFTFLIDPPLVIDGTPKANPSGEQLQWDWMVNEFDVSQTGHIKITKMASIGVGTPGFDTEGYEYTFGFVFDTIDDFDLSISGVWDGEDVSQTIHVPEPFTIALLGLGSIMIRRRR